MVSRHTITSPPLIESGCAPQKHNNLTEEQQRLFNTAVFAQIVTEDPAEPRELSTLYIAAADDYGGPDRAFEHGMRNGLERSNPIEQLPAV